MAAIDSPRWARSSDILETAAPPSINESNEPKAFYQQTTLKAGGVTLEVETEARSAEMSLPSETMLWDLTEDLANDAGVEEVASWLWKDETEARLGHMVIVSALRSGKNPVTDVDVVAEVVVLRGAFAAAVVRGKTEFAPDPLDVAQGRYLATMAASYGLGRLYANDRLETDVELRERIKATLDFTAAKRIGSEPGDSISQVQAQFVHGVLDLFQVPVGSDSPLEWLKKWRTDVLKDPLFTVKDVQNATLTIELANMRARAEEAERKLMLAADDVGELRGISDSRQNKVFARDEQLIDVLSERNTLRRENAALKERIRKLERRG